MQGTHDAVEDTRNETIQIYINGEFYLRSEAKISVFDSGYLVGDGIWEGIRLHQGCLVFIEDHLKRLWEASQSVKMKLPFSQAELIEKIEQTLKINGMSDGVHIRVMLTRGIKKTPSQDPRLTISGPNLVIIPEYKEASAETKQRGVRLFTSTIRRGTPDYLDPRLNCHSKLHEVQALIQALEAGADEALMLDINGFVSTCNATNFFMIRDGAVWTSTGQYCMQGITRAKILEICRAEGIPCREKNFSLYDAYAADEAFVTGTFGGLTPVTEIDGRAIGLGKGFGPLTLRLHELYQDLIEQTVIQQKKP